MSIAIKAMADGQLANTKGTLYTTPASTQAVAKNIILVNTGAGANTVNLYVQRDGSNSRRIIPEDLSLAAGAQFVMSDELTLEAADLIEGDASTAAEVDYVINGITES